MHDLGPPIAKSGLGRCLLFSVRTRGVLLRATIVLCIIALVLILLLVPSSQRQSPLLLAILLPIFCGTALLQFLSAFRLKYVLGVVDLVLVLGQLGSVIHAVIFLIVYDLYFGTTAIGIAASIAVYSLTILLFLQCIWRIGATISTRGRNLWAPFDIQMGTPLAQKRRTLYIFAGAFVWRKLFPRESNIIRILRGLFAVAFLTILVIFAYTNVVSYPLSEFGLGVRVKTFRTRFPEDALVEQIGTPAWNIFVVVNWDPHWRNVHFDTSSTEFRQAVQVLPLYHNQTGPPCENVDGDADTTVLNTYPSRFKWTFKVICPIIEQDNSWYSEPIYPFLYWPEDTPDLFVTVNFTSLGISAANASADSPSERGTRSTVSVVAGLSNITTDVLSNAQAATISPNEHLISGVDAHIRQRFVEASAAILGLSSLSKMRTFLVADLVGLRPNPSSTISRDNNTGSVYLYRQPHQTEDWTIVVDYREDSVLSGLSQVGGFWTLVNGFIAFVFGSRLMLIFFGVKPLSTFGLIHRFSRVDLSDSYPRIVSEGALPESQRGLVAFIREHMVDLGSVKGSDDLESRQERDIEMEMEEGMLRSSSQALHSSSTDSVPLTKVASLQDIKNP